MIIECVEELTKEKISQVNFSNAVLLFTCQVTVPVLVLSRFVTVLV